MLACQLREIAQQCIPLVSIQASKNTIAKVVEFLCMEIINFSGSQTGLPFAFQFLCLLSYSELHGYQERIVGHSRHSRDRWPLANPHHYFQRAPPVAPGERWPGLGMKSNFLISFAAILRQVRRQPVTGAGVRGKGVTVRPLLRAPSSRNALPPPTPTPTSMPLDLSPHSRSRS